MTTHTDAWWCPDCWGRHELEPNGKRGKRTCPDCPDTKMHRCSRYEWFLEDAIDAALMASGREYRIRPQYPILDHRGFYWYWDIGVWVVGSSSHGGHGLLIDINGPDHLEQKTYSGAGGGYTRDYDKVWELGQQRLHHKGWDHLIVRNDECKRAGNVVYGTANDIVTRLIGRA